MDLTGLTIEELRLADNVTDTDWRAKYQPQGTRSSDSPVPDKGRAGSNAGASPEVLAGTGEGACGDSLAEAAGWAAIGKWMVGE